MSEKNHEQNENSKNSRRQGNVDKGFKSLGQLSVVAAILFAVAGVFYFYQANQIIEKFEPQPFMDRTAAMVFYERQGYLNIGFGILCFGLSAFVLMLKNGVVLICGGMRRWFSQEKSESFRQAKDE